MSFTYNTTEEYIKELYNSIGIFNPNQLNPLLICEPLNLSVAYLPARSKRVDDHIFLDERLPANVQWQEFGHELCHALWHPDNQYHLTKPYIEYQENQANNFSYFACVPTQMLMEIVLPDSLCEAIRKVSATFNVTPDFAQKRLEMHINKIYQVTP